MTYQYESSNPERFQHLCQSLLLQEFPGLQCFPVGQPDGGRDAWSVDEHNSSKTVIQVKFRRADDVESAEWMISALEGELPKIKILEAAGASQYIMVTNARGTAHPGSGRIDKVQNWLKDNLQIPAKCLWRDDIDARMRIAPATIRWNFPEILSGLDGIQLAIESSLHRESQRISRVLRLFVAEQFNKDRKVKFKQVDLSNDLSALFIDVPVSPNLPELRNERSDERQRILRSFRTAVDRERLSAKSGNAYHLDTIRSEFDYGTHFVRRRTTGAANLLLSLSDAGRSGRYVLQGAPGQGKSTLAQFVCQTYRAQFLNKKDFIDAFPSHYFENTFRVPIKIDLRDLAAYYNRDEHFQHASPTTQLSMEGFLSLLISAESGGQTFSPDDVIETLSRIPVLLFFDGLDEVASPESRLALVDAVAGASNRWSEIDSNFQIIITSRPAVFGKSPSYQKFGFHVFSLVDIQRENIDDYASKWIVAKGLDQQEAIDIRGILGEKLSLGHIRDLARNPMQLAILLSLINSFGYSLPDERTDLYRQYIDLFLTRESEKTASVRNNRKLLVEIIEYIAWFLQTQAESNGTSGSLSEQELRQLVQEYLIQGQHDVSLLDSIFLSGLERIFVLVQRVAGMYEFEVQPLREYFCAHYLYATAPTTLGAREITAGDRSDRLAAMAINPFWMNVTRFYAGMYVSGELADVVFTLKELIASPDLAISIQARRVSAALLRDWIFRTKKFAQRELIVAAFDDLGLALGVASLFHSDEEVLTLSEECGRNDLRQLVFERLAIDPASPQAVPLSWILSENGGSELRSAFERILIEASGSRRTRILNLMAQSDAMQDITPGDAYELIHADHPGKRVVNDRSLIILSMNPEAVQCEERLTSNLLEGALNCELGSALISRNGILGTFTSIVSGQFDRRESTALKIDRIDPDLIAGPTSSIVDIQKARRVLESVFSDWANHEGGNSASVSLFPWNCIVESARMEFGEQWSLYRMACEASGIQSRSEKGRGKNDLFDNSAPLCDRARYGRLQRGGSAWWLDQESRIGSDLESMFWLLMVLLWARGNELVDLTPRIEARTAALDDVAYRKMLSAVWSLSLRHKEVRSRIVSKRAVPDSKSQRAVILFNLSGAVDLATLSGPSDGDSVVEQWFSSRIRQSAEPSFPGWSSVDHASNKVWLEVFSKTDSDSGIGDMIRQSQQHLTNMPKRVASDILAGPLAYPRILVDLAMWKVDSSYTPDAVSTCAERGEWIFT